MKKNICVTTLDKQFRYGTLQASAAELGLDFPALHDLMCLFLTNVLELMPHVKSMAGLENLFVDSISAIHIHSQLVPAKSKHTCFLSGNIYSLSPSECGLTRINISGLQN